MNDVRLIKQLVCDLNGQFSIAQFAEEELVPTYDDSDGINLNTSEIEPAGSFYNISLEPTDKSEFNFFADGKQRTIQIANLSVFINSEIRIIPVHYYSIGIVILKRANKKLSLWNRPILETGIVLHKKAVIDKNKINTIENLGLQILDTSHFNEDDVISDYYELKRWALQEVKDRRLEVERELVAKWVDEEKDCHFLVFDGSLINLRGEENIKRCIGISRSSRINIDSYDRIIQLQEFERSWTFTFHEAGDQSNMGVRNRVSWFLRIRDKQNNNPEFGLLRLELHPSYTDKAVLLADRFSKSVVIERLPTSYPDNSWDNTLYPIAVCSKYLSAIMPSVRSIKASMKI